MNGGEAEKKSSGGRPRRWLGQLVLIIAIFAVLQWWRAEPLASGDAPPLAGRLVATQEVFDLAELRGRATLVHFWATWCPLCKLGDDSIDSIAGDFPVITVAMQSGSTADVAEHMDREGLSFPVLPDPYGEMASRWGVHAVPTSFVVDSRGKIRFASVGYTTETGLRGRLWAASKLD